MPQNSPPISALNIVDRRYDFVLLFDVQDGNPNGDPDAGNMPRLDPQTLQGYVTDVCLKRKIRNAVAALKNNAPGYELYFQTQDAAYEKRVLNLLHESAYQQLKIEKTKTEKKGKRDKSEDIRAAREWMCRNFYDVRTFGAVMSTGEFNCGQVRGPVQLTFARSVDPILTQEVTVTRKSVTTVEEAEKQVQTNGTIIGTMGRKNTIPYALYRVHGFINPQLARDTRFTYTDLKLLFRAIQIMFDLDRSAARGNMAVRGLHVFQHSSVLGDAPAHRLFDRLRVSPVGQEKPARSFEDYRARIAVPVNGDLPERIMHRDLADVDIQKGDVPWIE